MNNLNVLIEQLQSKPETVEFKHVIDIIDEYYNYSASSFNNGEGSNCIKNKARENEGSCKIFAFAMLHKLNKEQALNCFGHYYRNDVLNQPTNTDHANIRAFMKYGWGNIVFDKPALKAKTTQTNNN